MLCLFEKYLTFIFLSNYIRKVIYIVFFLSSQTVHTQWLDAYIPDFKVNDDNLNSYQVNSQIGVDSAGNFVIVWSDARINPGESYPVQVYCQRYNKDGLLLGVNFKIGQDTASGSKITVLKDGRFIVTWSRIFRLNSIQHYEYYYQRFSKEGNLITPPLKIIDTSFIVAEEFGTGLSIASDSLGRFLICWGKKPNLNSFQSIYYQRFDSTGTKIGTVDSVNEALSDAEFPSVAMNKDGSFVIVWQDNRQEPFTTKYDIYMQRYNTAGVKIGNNVKVNDDLSALMNRGGAQVSTDAIGNTVIAWNDPRSCGSGEIFYQLFSTKGNTVGANRIANSSPCGAGTNSRVVSMRHDRYFYIGWSDWFYSGREQFYGRKFDTLGIPIGNAYMITSNSPFGTTQRANDVKLINDRVYSTWHDNRNGGSLNYDIYCNVRGFQNPDTVIGIIKTLAIVNEYMLYDAYPNPFNPVTNIKYQISKSAAIKITIFDIKGQQIEVLEDKEQLAGTYEITWDAGSKASGIYFVRMESQTGFNQTKKIMLIK